MEQSAMPMMMDSEYQSFEDQIQAHLRVQLDTDTGVFGVDSNIFSTAIGWEDNGIFSAFGLAKVTKTRRQSESCKMMLEAAALERNSDQVNTGYGAALQKECPEAEAEQIGHAEAEGATLSKPLSLREELMRARQMVSVKRKADATTPDEEMPREGESVPAPDREADKLQDLPCTGVGLSVELQQHGECSLVELPHGESSTAEAKPVHPKLRHKVQVDSSDSPAPRTAEQAAHEAQEQPKAADSPAAAYRTTRQSVAKSAAQLKGNTSAQLKGKGGVPPPESKLNVVSQDEATPAAPPALSPPASKAQLKGKSVVSQDEAQLKGKGVVSQDEAPELKGVPSDSSDEPAKGVSPHTAGASSDSSDDTISEFAMEPAKAVSKERKGIASVSKEGKVIASPPATKAQLKGKGVVPQEEGPPASRTRQRCGTAAQPEAATKRLKFQKGTPPEEGRKSTPPRGTAATAKAVSQEEAPRAKAQPETAGSKQKLKGKGAVSQEEMRSAVAQPETPKLKGKSDDGPARRTRSTTKARSGGEASSTISSRQLGPASRTRQRKQQQLPKTSKREKGK